MERTSVQTATKKTVGKTIYIISVLIAVLAFALIALWWTADDLERQIDFRSAVLRSTPNQFLMCPADYCADVPHMASPEFQIPRAELERLWDSMMDKKLEFEQLKTHDRDHRRHYEQRSKRLRFPDRITVEFLELDDAASTLAVYSRSKYGYSDVGVNEARVKSLLKDLTEQVP